MKWGVLQLKPYSSRRKVGSCFDSRESTVTQQQNTGPRWKNPTPNKKQKPCAASLAAFCSNGSFVAAFASFQVQLQVLPASQLQREYSTIQIV